MKKKLLMIMLLFTTVTTWAETIDGVKYIDENGVERTANGVTVLTGGAATTLTAGWYVCNSENLNYTGRLYLDGEVHLILADGCHMNIGSSSARISDGILGGNTLTIYSQSLGNDMGALGIYTNKQEAIYVSALTINGGNITADVIGTHVLFANDGAITINGGNITARTDGENSIALFSFSYYGGNIIINGGSVTATANTNANGTGINASTITIGWKNTTDFIKASSYKGTLQTVDGKSFVAYDGENTTAFVSGTVDDVTILAGKTLKPLDSHVVSIGSEGFSFDKDADFVIGDTRYYKYAANANVTLSYTGYGFVQVTSATLNAVENQPMQRSFTMPATDVALTATAVTGLTATAVTYDGEAHVPVVKQGENAFAAANYAIAYKQGENAVTEAKNVGNYTCTMTGLGQYIGTTSVDFAIMKRSTSLAVEIVDPVTTVDGHPLLISGDDAHVKVTLVPVAGANETTELPQINGYVTISVNDGINAPKPYTVAIVNGEGHYYVTNLAQGAYDITADFDGDANYTASATEDATTLEGCMILTETTSSLDKTSINVGEAVNVSIKINEVGLQRPVIDDETHTNKTIMFEIKQPLSIDDIVTVKCKTPWDNGEGASADVNNYTTAIVNGQGIRTYSHLPAGPRTVYVVYAGNDRYTNSKTISTVLQVNKKATTIGVEVTSPVIAK